MCGRYTYYSSEEILKQFDLEPSAEFQLALDLPDNFNVSPSAHMPVIVRGTQANRLEYMVWGLIPAWSKSTETSMKLINARRESLSEKPMWKRLVNSKRCIVPARGFYEWKNVNGKKIPYYITPINGNVFSFAGLWDDWHDSEGVEIQSYTIITTNPNKEMSAIHDRMPAILDKKQAEIWLSPEPLNQNQIDDFLAPIKNESLKIVQVSTRVNFAGNNDKTLIYPLPE